MSKYIVVLYTFIFGSIILLSFSKRNTSEVHDIQILSVESLSSKLGAKKLIHSMATFDPVKAEIGEMLILNGYSTLNGKRSKKISKYFVCTDCHNLKREFNDLASESATDRLEYAVSNGLPFLQGSTFWGIYNRTSFYNGDYVNKYGDLALNARDSLGNAIQVCSKYCSSGRYLKDWELEAILHYYKKNELKVRDLELTEEEKIAIQNSAVLSELQKISLLKDIQKKYRQSYSATFLGAMPKNLRKYGVEGNVKNGEMIYDKSCLHCHAYKRVTYLSIDKGVLSARMFWRNIENYSDKSLYQIIRWGTHSKPGRKQYMPRYTKEKMNDDQLNDLVAYIKQLAKK